MILHLVNDEKIINRTIQLFENACPGEHLFVVFKRQKETYVKRGPAVISAEEYEMWKDKFSIDSVIIHSLSKKKIYFIRQYKFEHIPLYWIIWGADLYNRLLEPQGFELYYRNTAYQRKKALKRYLLKPFTYFKMKNRIGMTSRFILERVNYLVTDTTENDYDILMDYFPQLKSIPWRDFFYYPIDEILGPDLLKTECDGNSIMIGNSASLTNNHEYALEILSRLNIGDRKIIVPLSYSGNKAYRKSVMERGIKLFGKQFSALTEFLPLQEYNELMTGVDIAIYGNWRQEAIGNIIIALYLGAKVFLSVRNPITAWARMHSLVVFELEKMTQQDLDQPLDRKIKESNRTILLDLYNRDRLVKLMKDTFQLA